MKNLKLILLLLSISVTMESVAQKDTVNAKLFFKDGKSIETRILNQPFRYGIKSIQNGAKVRIPARKLDSMHLPEARFHYFNDWILRRSYRVLADGNVQFYKRKSAYTIRLEDYQYMQPIFDLGSGKWRFKRYINDHPKSDSLTASLSPEKADSILSVYNQWKAKRSESQSRMEELAHRNKLVSGGFSIFFPSVYIQFGLTKQISIYNQFGQVSYNLEYPFNEWGYRYSSQLRWSFFQNRWRKKKRWSQDYSGPFVGVGYDRWMNVPDPYFYSNNYQVVVGEVSAFGPLRLGYYFGLGYNPTWSTTFSYTLEIGLGI